MLKIEVSQVPPPESFPNWRGHWVEKYRATKAYRETVYLECVNVRNLTGEPWATEKHVFSRAKLSLTFVFHHQQGWDEDNLRASFKAGQDALVQAQLIPNDTPKYLELGPIEIVVDRRRSPKTIIYLEQL